MSTHACMACRAGHCTVHLSEAPSSNLCAAHVVDDEGVIYGCSAIGTSARSAVGNPGPHDGERFLVALCDEHAVIADGGQQFTITLDPADP